MTEEQWDQVLTVNLKGTFLCAQAASKAGVIGAHPHARARVCEVGVTVTCVAPGPVMPRMLASVPEAIDIHDVPT